MPIFNRQKKLLTDIPAFMHANKNLLIIICDPKDDRVYAGFRDHFVNGKIKSVKGKSAHVVREVLKYGRFNTAIDGFMGSIAETLQLPILKANNFYKFLDGAVFAIAKSLRKKRQAPKGEPVPSPFAEARKVD